MTAAVQGKCFNRTPLLLDDVCSEAGGGRQPNEHYVHTLVSCLRTVLFVEVKRTLRSDFGSNTSVE